jgi:hypothetical protein
MLDIEAIINRHLSEDKMEGKTFHEGHIAIDLHNAIEEIKRLREDVATPAEHEKGARIAAYASGALEGQDSERAAVVAWLRDEAEAAAQTYTVQAAEWARRIDNIADNIEHDAHRREEKP